MAAGAALLLYLVFFRAGTFVFPFPTCSNGVFFDEAWRIVSGQVMYRVPQLSLFSVQTGARQPEGTLRRK